jgi:quercetin dioxygenase-like cupin family protein
MIKRVARDEAQCFPLPGRNWYLYIGPENSATQHLTVGTAVFPPGSKPPGHIHDTQEEIIYIMSGHGRLVTPEATAQLEPGVSVFIPIGTFHATESDGPEPLHMVCSFSPPVVPGSYERGQKS